MKRRVLGLALCETILVAGGLLIVGRQAAPGAHPGLGMFFGFTAALCLLALLPRVYVEHRRHGCWITPADCAMLMGLFALGPVAFLGAAMIAEVATALRFRQGMLKMGFNLVHALGGYTAAAMTFAVLGRTDPLDPVAWLAGVAALAACAAWDTISTAAVLALSEEQDFVGMLGQIGPAVLVSLVLSAFLGLTALILFLESAYGPLLFAPVLGILVASTRAVSQQRSERQRFQQLYEASSNLTRLVSLPDMLSLIAAEATGLVTGAAAICCTKLPDGSWTGMLVNDEGTHAASEASLQVLTALAEEHGSPEIAAAALDRELRAALPAFTSMVWTAKHADPSGTVLLAVFRELPPDEQGAHRSDILTAFVAHAATVVANVGLHEDVQRSLDHQMELNRQKSDFVAAVSHELRTPLAGMIGSIQTVKRLGERMKIDDRERILQMGLTEGTRLRGLIEDLLLVAAAEHKEAQAVMQPLLLADVLTDLAAELAPLMGDRLEIEVDPGVGMVVSDADKLRRIVVNLVENARKYAPEGPIEVTALRTCDGVTITVDDHGPGIPPDDRERVFERFVQLDQSATRRQGGTGLGLHLCRELAALLGGALTVTAAPAGGARFSLVLTQAPLEDDAPAEPSAVRTRPPGIARSPLARPAGLPPRPPPLPAESAAQAMAAPGGRRP